MEKKTIAEFFDRCAPWWDADMIRNEEIIAAILNNGGVRPAWMCWMWPVEPVSCSRTT